MDCCSWCSVVLMYLDLEVMQKSTTYRKSLIQGFRHLVMLLILGWTGLQIVYCSKRLPFLHFGNLTFWTLDFLFDKIFFMKLGNLPFSARLHRPFIIPYFQVVSCTFSRLKKIAMKCCFWIFPSFMEVSNLTIWSIVDLWFLKPHWQLVIRSLCYTPQDLENEGWFSWQFKH